MSLVSVEGDVLGNLIHVASKPTNTIIGAFIDVGVAVELAKGKSWGFLNAKN